jgi:hypothetical protein
MSNLSPETPEENSNKLPNQAVSWEKREMNRRGLLKGAVATALALFGIKKGSDYIEQRDTMATQAIPAAVDEARRQEAERKAAQTNRLMEKTDIQSGHLPTSTPIPTNTPTAIPTSVNPKP